MLKLLIQMLEKYLKSLKPRMSVPSPEYEGHILLAVHSMEPHSVSLLVLILTIANAR